MDVLADRLLGRSPCILGVDQVIAPVIIEVRPTVKVYSRLRVQVFNTARSLSKVDCGPAPPQTYTDRIRPR